MPFCFDIDQAARARLRSKILIQTSTEICATAQALCAEARAFCTQAMELRTGGRGALVAPGRPRVPTRRAA